MFCTQCNAPLPDLISTCPRCGAACGASSSPGTGSELVDQCLSPGVTLMGGHYRVSRVLGHGGFGVTYEGLDTTLELPVAIKEYFPSGCFRRGLDLLPGHKCSAQEFAEQRVRFLDEARVLAHLDHAGIVRVHTAFEENNTAYMVMEYLRGQSLDAMIREHGRLGEDRVLEMVVQLADALAALHGRGTEGILHRDIKPANIMVTPEGRAVLIDFGAARQFAANVSHSMSQVLTPGYAPIEQYSSRARFAPTVDIYALGATMYHALTGHVPPDAADRSQGAELVPPHVLCPSVGLRTSNVVVVAMEMAAPRRPQAVGDLVALLKRGSRSSSAPTVASPPSPPPVVKAVPPQGVPQPVRKAESFPTGPILPPGLRLSGTNPKGFQEIVNEKDGTVLVRIPGGTCPVGGEDSADEKPPHLVTLPPYLMARLPVTGAQFARFVSTTGYDAGGMWKNFAARWGDQAPVVCVSHDDALAYCAWAGLRLPSEEEWEHAARGPQGNTYPWGSQFDSGHCQNSTGSPRPGAAPVGSFPSGASHCGCLDMAGNVWEWTDSWYEPYPGNTTPSEHFGRTHRVVRGGSWYNDNPSDLRCAFRFRNLPGNRGRLYGFRCARDAP